MLELEEALARILARLPKPTTENIPLGLAVRRIAGEQIIAPCDLPLFDNSSMDGYAVRAADVANAGSKSPIRLRVIGRVAAGDFFDKEVQSGECVRIFTGSPLPRGADAIVMQEDTQTDSGENGSVLVLDSVKPWENVRFHGEDVKRGTTLVEAGEEFNVGRIAVLAAMGLGNVTATRRPTVGVLATGTELKLAGESLAPGQIYESNRITLTPLIESAGGISRAFPIVKDDPSVTLAALKNAFAQCDIVITCGGVSVGEMDFVKSAFEELGGQLDFWKVSIKPGKPFVFGQLGNRFLFGLPGNPISAFVTFLLLARPALLQWQGAANTTPPLHSGVLAEQLSNPGDRRHFMRVHIDDTGTVRSSGTQASHVLSSLAAAKGLVDVPPRTTLPAGTTVQVIRWD
jgi:molybdopterin molybdotransferase